MPLQFGLQTGPRYFPEQGPTLTPDEEQLIQGIVDARRRAGKLPAGQEAAYTTALRNLATAANGGDDTALAAFKKQYDESGLGSTGGIGSQPYGPPAPPELASNLPEGWDVATYQGKTYITRDEPVYEDIYNSLGDKTGRQQTGTRTVIVDEITPSSAGADQAKARLDAALANNDITPEEYKAAIKNLALTGSLRGTGAGGTSFDTGPGYLDLAQRRFNELELPQLALQKQQAAIGASRAGNPLAYFGLTTGKTPQEALTEVPLAPYQSAIRMGGPVGKMFVSGPGNETAPQGFRLPGVQAQGRMTPLQNAANLERNAVEFGVPDVEQEFLQNRLRRGFFGSGGTSFGFGGTAT